MMMGQEDNRELISREELLKLANELIKKRLRLSRRHESR